MKKIIPLTMVAAAGFLISVPSATAITYLDRATWEAAAGTFADVDLPSLVNPIAEFDVVDSLTLPSGTTLAFNTFLQALQVGSGWETWSSGTPMVLWSLGLDAVGATASAVLNSFGLEMQPGLFEPPFDITLLLSNGEFLTQSVSGDGGAAFFGWVNEPVVGFSMSVVGSDFAFGRMVEGPGATPPGVPDGGSLGLMSGLVWAGLLGLGTLRRKTK
jgi:hypothetical protein